ncbi:hypothetical protein [Luteolibacter sp. LG18]|uniref:hypothetical protein n=1 Tax=Luteolibacter sp. LG18 TaxID=2819286 RepID=UPI002B2A7EC7|nr:SAM-dependent methyltransferase [Luteolibacter sp. LG18]
MTDWEFRYRHHDTPWEKGSAAPPLLELMERWNAAPPWGGGEVLAPGCGFGHDVRVIASTGVPVLGLDLAAAAVEGARGFPSVGQERYLQADLFDRSWWPAKGFTGWWEHTCFCAIDPVDRPRYAEAAGALVRPGGWLCGVFFLTPNERGEESCGPPFDSTIGEIEGLLAPWFERVDAWVPTRSYPGREGREWVAIFRRKQD